MQQLFTKLDSYFTAPLLLLFYQHHKEDLICTVYVK